MNDPESNYAAWIGKAENDLLNIENNLAAERVGKGARNLLPERPSGCFAQKVPGTVSPSTLNRPQRSCSKPF